MSDHRTGCASDRKGESGRRWRRLAIGVLAGGVLAAASSATGQEERRPEAILGDIRDSFERNVEEREFCRKDTAGDWVAKLMTCLGRFRDMSSIIAASSGEISKHKAEVEQNRKRIEELERSEKALEAELEKLRREPPLPEPVAPPKPVPPQPSVDVTALQTRIEGLEADLRICRTRDLPGPGDPGSIECKAALHSIADLKNELMQMRKGADRLRERLISLGISPEPGFAFAGEGAFSMTAAQVERDGIPGTGRRLTTSDCREALTWLKAQPAWNFSRIWVFEGSALRLCEGPTGEPKWDGEWGPNTEAHAIVFR